VVSHRVFHPAWAGQSLVVGERLVPFNADGISAPLIEAECDRLLGIPGFQPAPAGYEGAEEEAPALDLGAGEALPPEGEVPAEFPQACAAATDGLVGEELVEAVIAEFVGEQIEEEPAEERQFDLVAMDEVLETTFPRLKVDDRVEWAGREGVTVAQLDRMWDLENKGRKSPRVLAAIDTARQKALQGPSVEQINLAVFKSNLPAEE
jgi:hypothetical protein